LVEQSLEKTTSGEAGESCVNEAVFKTPLKPGDVMNYDAVRCHWNDGPVTGAVFHLSLVSRSSGSTSPWEAVLQATANSRQKFPNIQYE
jgi:hypothetical protein